MALSGRRALIFGRRLLICAGAGFACGAIVGVLIVLIGWLPGAMATYAENPQFVDPRQSVLAWCATWAVVCGAVGLVIGGTAGAFRAATPSSN